MSSSIRAEPRKQPLIVFSLMKPQVSIVTAEPFGGSPTTTAVPPGAKRVPRLADRLLATDRLEGVVHAAARRVAHPPGRLCGRPRNDRRGRAKPLRELELLRTRVDRDDGSRSGQARGLDDRKPDASAAPDGDARPLARRRPSSSRPPNRSRRRSRRALRRRAARPRRMAHATDSGTTAYSANDDTALKWCSVSPSTERRDVPSASIPVRGHPPAQLAEVGSTCSTRRAVAHEGTSASTTWSPGRTRVTRARLDDDPRSFVTENERKRLGEVTVDHVEVARADAAGRDADQDLTPSCGAPVRHRRPRPAARRSEDGCLCPHGRERIAPGP